MQEQEQSEVAPQDAEDKSVAIVDPTVPPSEKVPFPAFLVGELFPWKGVWFKVEEVASDAVLLRVQGFTHKALIAMRRKEK